MKKVQILESQLVKLRGDDHIPDSGVVACAAVQPINVNFLRQAQF